MFERLAVTASHQGFSRREADWVLIIGVARSEATLAAVCSRADETAWRGSIWFGVNVVNS